jgi:hypothetical protein
MTAPTNAAARRIADGVNRLGTNVSLKAIGMGAAVAVTDCRSRLAEILATQKKRLMASVVDVPALSDAIRHLTPQAALRQHLGAPATTVRHTFDADGTHGERRALLESAASPQAVTARI